MHVRVVLSTHLIHLSTLQFVVETGFRAEVVEFDGDAEVVELLDCVSIGPVEKITANAMDVIRTLAPRLANYVNCFLLPMLSNLF